MSMYLANIETRGVGSLPLVFQGLVFILGLGTGLAAAGLLTAVVEQTTAARAGTLMGVWGDARWGKGLGAGGMPVPLLPAVGEGARGRGVAWWDAGQGMGGCAVRRCMQRLYNRAGEKGKESATPRQKFEYLTTYAILNPGLVHNSMIPNGRKEASSRRRRNGKSWKHHY